MQQTGQPAQFPLQRHAVRLHAYQNVVFGDRAVAGSIGADRCTEITTIEKRRTAERPTMGIGARVADAVGKGGRAWFGASQCNWHADITRVAIERIHMQRIPVVPGLQRDRARLLAVGRRETKVRAAGNAALGVE
ncbi:MAG: hypothetical protein LH632_18690 [Rhodoferax sp.]|nr:hypothetical protein [Rhodoferax sp.]